MKEKRTIFDYLAEILMIFAITMIFMMVITKLFGEEANAISSMFRLGGQGIPLEIMAEFLGTSTIMVFLRYIFYSDTVIHTSSIMLRTVMMVTAVTIVIIIAAALFSWFPINKWEPWVAFVICFALFFGTSTLIMSVKTSLENKQMDEALKKLQAEWKEGENDGKQN